MDHVDYRLKGSVTFFFIYSSLHAFVERDEVWLIGSLAPLPLLLGVFPVLGI